MGLRFSLNGCFSFSYFGFVFNVSVDYLKVRGDRVMVLVILVFRFVILGAFAFFLGDFFY